MKIVSVGTMRALERAAVNSGVSEYRLMRRAGIGAAAALERFAKGRFRRVVFFCGSGNNAGDAVVAAGSLTLPHVLLPFRPLEELRGAAADAVREFGPRLNVCTDIDAFDFEPGDLAADALLGTGFSGSSVRAPLDRGLALLGRAGGRVAAFDLPSGLDADSGRAVPGTVKARLTLAFGAPKQGMFLREGPELCGRSEVIPIGLDLNGAERALDYDFYTGSDAADASKRPPLTAHKNTRGRVLVLCGSADYPGAAVLASSAALRFAGLVRSVMAESGLSFRLPAALIRRCLPPGPGGALPPDALKRCADFAAVSDALGAGCGWGSAASPELLKEVLAFPGPVVLDADGLNLLARHPELWSFRSDAVLTPHPGEAARLAAAFGVDGALPRERFAAALAEKLGTTVVLKGFHTCVAAPGRPVSVNSSGGPELAVAGSGDVLAGIITGLLAGGKAPFDGARLGVFLHGLAGDEGGFPLIADELPLLAAKCRDHLW